MGKLHVIAASYNRAATTTVALQSLADAAAEADIEFDLTLFDDGSTDDTVAQASTVVSQLDVIRGDGSAFWARSMARAEDVLLSRTDVVDDDWLMWFNDDVVLERSGIESMLSAARRHFDGIVVGSAVDPDTGELTYGGLQRRGTHPLAYDLVKPPGRDGEATEADSFNGNVVLMSVRTARRVGPIDGAFSHAFADIDYGVRARGIGVPIVLAGGYVGSCSRNPVSHHTSVRAAWRAHLSRKGAGNPQALKRFLRKHKPRSWWFFLGSSYLLWWVRIVLDRMSPRRGER